MCAKLLLTKNRLCVALLKVFRQKCDTFSRSADAVFELSTRFSTPFSFDYEKGLSTEAKLKQRELVFRELTQGKLVHLPDDPLLPHLS